MLENGDTLVLSGIPENLAMAEQKLLRHNEGPCLARPTAGTHIHAQPERQPVPRNHIRTVPDWPAPGVQFRDITPLLQDPRCSGC
jgi:hypothetical protein